MNILTVSTADRGGGAERIARSLASTFESRAHQSFMAVGRKISNESNVYEIPNEAHRSSWEKYWKQKSLGVISAGGPATRFFKHGYQLLSSPHKKRNWWRGYENFDFPGTQQVMALLPKHPDLISCHNLHGEYFDLRELTQWSSKIPVVLSLHDAWLLSGHCAHSFQCERWKTGCGDCPDLTIPPSIQNDATAENWSQKNKIYRASKLYVTTPCDWLMNKVNESMLAPSIVESKVIPYGIDLKLYSPGSAEQVRAALGIKKDALVFLFSANQFMNNRWKNYRLIKDAIIELSKQNLNQDFVFIGLGEAAPDEIYGRVRLTFIPFSFNRTEVEIRDFYRAADIYLHASHADTFPLAVLEAEACGRPVIATGVGGIPEQIRSLDQKAEAASGIVFSVSDGHEASVERMLHAILKIVKAPNLRLSLGLGARALAEQRFDLNFYASRHLEWYQSILEKLR